MQRKNGYQTRQKTLILSYLETHPERREKKRLPGPGAEKETEKKMREVKPGMRSTASHFSRSARLPVNEGKRGIYEK